MLLPSMLKLSVCVREQGPSALLPLPPVKSLLFIKPHQKVFLSCISQLSVSLLRATVEQDGCPSNLALL